MYIHELWVDYRDYISIQEVLEALNEQNISLTHSLSFSLCPSLCHFSLPLPPGFFSQENKTNAAAIATESKGRPGPGLSPLERPDWSRPAVWALLLCGRRGRQFSECCCGRGAISAVLSGRIYTAGSTLIFFSLLWHICRWIKANISTAAQWWGQKICWLVECSLTGYVRDLFELVKNHGLLFFFVFRRKWKKRL